MIEWIANGEHILAGLISADHIPERSEFVTPDSYKQQIGFIAYPSGNEIAPHIHHEMERSIRGTSEVLLVRKGRCLVDFYLEDKSYFCTRELRKDDTLVLVGGGHGFRMLEDTVFLEVKQGPYIGPAEKERFPRPPL